MISYVSVVDVMNALSHPKTDSLGSNQRRHRAPSIYAQPDIGDDTPSLFSPSRVKDWWDARAKARAERAIVNPIRSLSTHMLADIGLLDQSYRYQSSAPEPAYALDQQQPGVPAVPTEPAIDLKIWLYPEAGFQIFTGQSEAAVAMPVVPNHAAAKYSTQPAHV